MYTLDCRLGSEKQHPLAVINMARQPYNEYQKTAAAAKRKAKKECPRFRFEMESRYMILRYCDKGWKANQTGIALYPSFKLTERRRLKRLGKVLPEWLRNDKNNAGEECEDENAEEPVTSLQVPGKRKSQPKVLSAEASRLPKRRARLDIADPL